MTLPQYATIALERAGRVLTLAFDRADALNAFDKAMHDEFPAALAFACDDEGSDVLVLTGQGKAFSAGGDFAHILANAGNPEAFDHEIEKARQIVKTLLDIEKPVICKLNGHAMGLGATIALLCDIVIASDKARIGDPHVNIGLVAGDGGVLAWPRRIGLARAKEYLLTGNPVAAPEAVAMGLVNRACSLEELDDTVAQLCAQLLAKPQFALRKTKALLNLETRRLMSELLDPGLAWEAQSVRDPDHAEAVRALMEKRAPVFRKP